MGSIFPWLITGFAVALLLVLWHYMVWRELSAHRETLLQLARQAAVNRDAAEKAQGGPYEESAQQTLSISILVYRKAAAEYNALRQRPLYRIPSKVLGLTAAPEEPSSMQDT